MIINSFEISFQGWKGYSNNIYIQPIIVNSQRNQENKNSLKSGTLTVEDLRQQLRLRQSSEWVVKHNQRMNLKGTLKTGAPNLKPEIDTSISRCHSSRTTTGNHPEVDFSQHSQRARQTSRLAKGFVCRHWERDYLSKENISHKAGEPSSLTIRSYVNVNVMDTLTKTVRAQEHKKRERPDITSRQDENTNESSPDCVDEKGHQPSRRSSLSSLSSNELIPKEDLHQDINDLIFGNISVNVRNSCTDESCTCRLSAPGSQGRILTCPGKSGKEKNKPRNLLKRRQEEKIFMPVPLKEFPPIDPLRDIKMSSSKFQTMGKRKLPRRPHTVGAPCSLSYINDKKKTESPRISSSKSLDNHFRGIHGKAVKHPSKNWQTRGRSSK